MMPKLNMKMSIPRNGMSLPRGGSITSSLARPVSEGGRPGVVKDSRPTSEKAFQKASTEHIYQWLISHSYDVQKSAKAFSGPIMSPSQSDFFGMVEFIYSRTWSPNFRLSLCADPAEGVLGVFRCLRYPFPLSKSSLASVAPHNIGNIIGSLIWLVELAEVDEEAGMGPTTTKRPNEEETVDQLWMNYLAESFKVANKPQASAKLDNDFREQLKQQLSLMSEAVAELERQSSDLKHDLQEEESKAKAAQDTANDLERRIAAITTDIPKYDQLVVQYGQRNAELENALVAKQQEANAGRAQLQAAAQEKAQLEAQVANQGFSAADRELILTERMSLQKFLQDTLSTKDQRSRDVAEAEIYVSRKIDEIERQIQAYQETLVRLSLLREDPRLAISLSTSTPSAEEQLLVQIKTVARPALKAMIEATKGDIRKETDEQLTKEERLLRLRERVQELDAQYERLEQELKEIEKRYSSSKEKSEAEVRQQEVLLQRVKNEGSMTKEQVLQELNAVRAESVSAEAQQSKEREQHRKELLQWEAQLMEMTKQLIDHKAAIHSALESLALESRRFLEAAQQQNQSQTQHSQQQSAPSSISRRVATPARPSLSFR